MSVLELFDYLKDHRWFLLGYTVGLPAFALLLRVGRSGETSRFRRYLYSLVVYLSCVPGIFVLFSSLYLVAFRRENLLALDLLVFALPVLSMVVTLVVVRKSIDFDDIPGFQRIAGLFALTIGTFALLFVLDRLRILLFFRASILWFVVLGVAIFVALKLGGRLLFGSRH